MKRLVLVAGVAGVASIATPTRADSDRGAQPIQLAAAAVRRTGAIEVDGRLDDATWKSAPPNNGFWQRFPDEGKPPVHDTEFHVAYDDKAVYFAVRAHDTEPEQVRGLLTRRDEVSASDWVFVGIDSYHDRRTAFVFGINPSGVQRDHLMYDDVMEDSSWDAVWVAAASVDDNGWTAEFKIPLSQLRFSAARDQEWGVQVGRVVGRSGEQTYWSPMPRAQPRGVSLFGTLKGLSGLEPGRRLELLPYVSGGIDIAPIDDADPFRDTAAPLAGAGIDLRYGLGSAFTLAASINPDFGQVEADPSQVNLSGNELFFPEKRPFFLEGIDIFQYSLSHGDGDLERLFYTRRIGAPPHAGVDGAYVDAPTATTIYGATKISGKAAGWSIGAIEAVTAEESARADDGAGTITTSVVEPLTNYALARVKRDFRDGGTSVGGIVTAVHRKLDGTGLEGLLHDQAYAGAGQVQHRFWSDKWSAIAKVHGTLVHGTPEAIANTQTLQRHLFQRPDAEHVEFDPTRTSLGGIGAAWAIGRDGATKNWRVATGGRTLSHGFEANDMGFHQQADKTIGWVWWQYRDDEPGKLFLNWNFNNDIFYWANWQPQLGGYGTSFNTFGLLKNQWGLNAWGAIETALWNWGALRGGPALRGDTNGNGGFTITSDERKRVQLSGTARLWRMPHGDSWASGFDLGANIQVRPNITVFVGAGYDQLWDDWQYIDTPVDMAGEPHYVFGRLDRKLASATIRGSWTFTPRLSLQVYAQPFIASGAYQQLKETADVAADDYDDRFHEFGREAMHDGDGTILVDRDQDGTVDFAFGKPDFNFREMRSNVVLRWEYRPGSTVFFIWSQGRTNVTADGRFDLSDGLAGLADAPSQHVVMVKANYWVGL
jgi:hypothetical protein